MVLKIKKQVEKYLLLKKITLKSVFYIILTKVRFRRISKRSTIIVKTVQKRTFCCFFLKNFRFTIEFTGAFCYHIICRGEIPIQGEPNLFVGEL